MLRTDFYFDLPQELIAQHPSDVRGQDKLMLLGRTDGSIAHHVMQDLPDLIDPDTLMIFNDSRVRRARVYGIKESTGREQEFMFLHQVDADGTSWKVLVHNAKKQKPGMRYSFPDGSIGTIIQHEGDIGTELRTIHFDFALEETWFDHNGHIPLPPYIKRGDTNEDSERYQTVYAKNTGSAACPTAGLHFTKELFERLDAKGIERDFVTLHVGLGTFLPVREDTIEEHKMHEEVFTVSAEVAQKINQAKKDGRPILGVGTTSVRTLESAADEQGIVQPGTRGTRIFIYPGYTWKVVDQMFTNFHTPESTLIMMVSAFASREHILNAYKVAVDNKYHFFSYGDAMLIK
ncbi:MAG: tRNA preQ1(34) S-adenosylmethionine ribosyltransferase-isomerase QueA [Treponema sp.]|nr:tRNA preQ1(34) S-adenosylmethionine ribosyltransferase-isomerase QueA [Treponema sp.]